MQMQQMRYQRFAFDRFGPTRIAQNRRHLGVSKARMAPHHRRVKLVSLYCSVFGNQHIADHAQAIHFRVE